MRATLIFAVQTLKELLHERILYNIFFVALFLLFFGYLAALLVFGYQNRVMLHLGTMANALSVLIVAVSAGSRSLHEAMQSRTAYLPLSRPVSRTSFFVGKWLGIIGFSVLNLILLSFLLWIGLKLTRGGMTLAFFQGLTLTASEICLFAAFALMLSVWLRPGLSIMVTVAFAFLSHNHEQLRFLREHDAGSPLLLRALELMSPNGSALVMDTRVYYENALPALEWLSRFSYGLLWAVLFLIVGNVFFHRKDL